MWCNIHMWLLTMTCDYPLVTCDFNIHMWLWYVFSWFFILNWIRIMTVSTPQSGEWQCPLRSRENDSVHSAVGRPSFPTKTSQNWYSQYALPWPSNQPVSLLVVTFSFRHSTRLLHLKLAFINLSWSRTREKFCHLIASLSVILLQLKLTKLKLEVLKSDF